MKRDSELFLGAVFGPGQNGRLLPLGLLHDLVPKVCVAILVLQLLPAQRGGLLPNAFLRVRVYPVRVPSLVCSAEWGAGVSPNSSQHGLPGQVANFTGKGKGERRGEGEVRGA